MSTLQATNIKNASSATTNLALDTAGNATVGNALIMGSGSFLRNRIINGDMRIDQRNAGASVSTPANSVTYVVDRMMAQPLSAATTAQRVASGRTDFPFAFRLNGAAGITALYVKQRVESVNCFDFAGQTGTFSAWVYNGTSSAISVQHAASYANAVDNFSAGTYIGGTAGVSCPAGQWTYVSGSMAFPSQAANGLELAVVLGAPTSGYMLVTGWQFEIGSVATPFERRQYGHELTLCQRYYQKFASTVITFVNTAASSYTWYQTMTTRVTMRVNGTGIANFTNLSGAGSGAITNITQDSFSLTFTYAAGTSTTSCLFAPELSAEL